MKIKPIFGTSSRPNIPALFAVIPKRLLGAVGAILALSILQAVTTVHADTGLYVPNRDGGTATNGEVLQYNSITGDFIQSAIPSLGIDIIQGMTLGPDGNLYLSVFDTRNNINGRILRYDLDGNFIDEFVSPGEGSLGSPVGLRFGPDGNLYVTSNAPGTDEILKYDGQTGDFIGITATGLITPQEIVFGPNGLLYVTNGNVFASSVYRFNPLTGSLVDVFIPTGSGGLSAPTGMAFGTDGNLYIASFPNHNVLRFNGVTGAFIDVFASFDVVEPRGDGPFDLVFGPDGSLYLNSGSGSPPPAMGIYRFDGNTGNFMEAFVPDGVGGLSRFGNGMLFVDAGCSRYRDGGFGNRCFIPPSTIATIDIKPGNKRNKINPRSRGGIWVAILSDTETPFDALQVDIPTVRFGPGGAEANRHKVKDVDKDGLPDLLLRFKIRKTGIACGDTEATLTGDAFGGLSITGTETVKTVGCN